MSDVNKLDDKKCSFSPDQYKKKIDNVAPFGSFPWAMIQVYSGKAVRRNGWIITDKYLKFTIGSTGSDVKNIPPQIWVVDKGDKQLWAPSQDDITSCDWTLSELVVFDINLGYLLDQNTNGIWGYDPENTGSLFEIENTTSVVKTSGFYVITGSASIFWWLFSINLSKENFQEVDDILSHKNLHIKVDGVTYNLGKHSIACWDEDAKVCQITYQGSELPKLIPIFMETGVTKRFYCYWQ